MYREKKNIIWDSGRPPERLALGLQNTEPRFLSIGCIICQAGEVCLSSGLLKGSNAWSNAALIYTSVHHILQLLIAFAWVLYREGLGGILQPSIPCQRAQERQMVVECGPSWSHLSGTQPSGFLCISVSLQNPAWTTFLPVFLLVFISWIESWSFT